MPLQRLRSLSDNSLLRLLSPSSHRFASHQFPKTGQGSGVNLHQVAAKHAQCLEKATLLIKYLSLEGTVAGVFTNGIYGFCKSELWILRFFGFPGSRASWSFRIISTMGLSPLDHGEQSFATQRTDYTLGFFYRNTQDADSSGFLTLLPPSPATDLFFLYWPLFGMVWHCSHPSFAPHSEDSRSIFSIKAYSGVYG